MEVLNNKHYVEKLAEKYSEVSEESIKAIIKAGNSELIKNAKKKYTRVTAKDPNNNYIQFYRHTGITANNKYKFIKRRKDAK